MEVTVQHEEFHTGEEFIDGIQQNSWCEDARDKEVVMAVKITGCLSAYSRIHRVHVNHCFSTKTARSQSSPSFERTQASLLHRSDFRHLGSSSDVVDDLHKLHIFHEDSV